MMQGENGTTGDTGLVGVGGDPGPVGEKVSLCIALNTTSLITIMRCVYFGCASHSLQGMKGLRGPNGENGTMGVKGDMVCIGKCQTLQWIYVCMCVYSNVSALQGMSGEKGDMGMMGEKGEMGSGGDMVNVLL